MVIPPSRDRHTIGQIPLKCKETLNLMRLSLIWFVLVLFVCWNVFCTIENLRIRFATEIKNIFVLFFKNLESSFSTLLSHLTLRFLYILGCSGPRCGMAMLFQWKKRQSLPALWTLWRTQWNEISGAIFLSLFICYFFVVLSRDRFCLRVLYSSLKCVMKSYFYDPAFPLHTYIVYNSPCFLKCAINLSGFMVYK